MHRLQKRREQKVKGEALPRGVTFPHLNSSSKHTEKLPGQVKYHSQYNGVLDMMAEFPVLSNSSSKEYDLVFKALAEYLLISKQHLDHTLLSRLNTCLLTELSHTKGSRIPPSIMLVRTATSPSTSQRLTSQDC